MILCSIQTLPNVQNPEAFNMQSVA